jgi:hypothetical protein
VLFNISVSIPDGSNEVHHDLTVALMSSATSESPSIDARPAPAVDVIAGIIAKLPALLDRARSDKLGHVTEVEDRHEARDRDFGFRVRVY